MKTEMIAKLGFGFIATILMLSSVGFAQGIQGLISTLKDIGVFQFYLPFLISFAIIYALLLKIKVFGDNKSLVTIIALAAAGFIMVYVPAGIEFGQFLTQFFGNSIVVILTIVVLVIFANMLKTGEIFDISGLLKGNWLWIGLLLILLVVFGVFVASGGTSIFPGLKISAKQLFGPIGGLSSTTWAIIVLIIGTGLVVLMFAKGEKGEKAAGGKP